MYTPEFADITTSFYWARTSDVPRVSQAGRDRALEIERQRCRDQTQEFYFCAFGCHLNSSQMNRFEEGLKTFGGRLTGHRGPYPSSFQFQMNTCLWDEITWENWGVFIHNLEFHFRLNRQNSSLPQNRVSTPPKAIKIEQAQDSISPYKANLEAAGWTDLQDVELCSGRETWGCPPGGVCPRKVMHEDIQPWVLEKLSERLSVWGNA